MTRDIVSFICRARAQDMRFWRLVRVVMLVGAHWEIVVCVEKTKIPGGEWRVGYILIHFLLSVFIIIFSFPFSSGGVPAPFPFRFILVPAAPSPLSVSFPFSSTGCVTKRNENERGTSRKRNKKGLNNLNFLLCWPLFGPKNVTCPERISELEQTPELSSIWSVVDLATSNGCNLFICQMAPQSGSRDVWS